MTREQRTKFDAWKYRCIVAWAIVGIAAVFWLATRAIGVVWPAVELLIAGVVIGFVCSPVTNWLAAHGVPRAGAAFVALLAFVAVVIVVCALIVPPTIEQVIELLRRVPLYAAQVQNALAGFWETFGTADTQQAQNVVNSMVQAASSTGTELAGDTINRLTSGVVTNLTNTVNGIITCCLGLVVGYWLAKDYPAMARELAVISGPDHERSTTMLLAVISRSMGGYMRGIVVTSIVNGLGSYVALVLIGHPYASLMGIMCGVFHVVPVIGPWLAVLLASGVALFTSPWLALWTLVLTIVIMNVTDNLVSPLVMQSAVKVHPALSLVGIIVGNALGGILGMALAIPLTAALRSAFVYFFERRTGRQIVSHDGAIFKSTPYVDDAGDIQPTFDALDDAQFFERSLLVAPENMPAAHAVPSESAVKDGVQASPKRRLLSHLPRRQGARAVGEASQTSPPGGAGVAQGTTMGQSQESRGNRDNRAGDGGDE